MTKLYLNNKVADDLKDEQAEWNAIQTARRTLEDAGYYVSGLYHVDDVKRYFDCTDAEAQQVLEGAIDNDGTAEQIWTAIREVGDMIGLKEVEQ